MEPGDPKEPRPAQGHESPSQLPADGAPPDSTPLATRRPDDVSLQVDTGIGPSGFSFLFGWFPFVGLYGLVGIRRAISALSNRNATASDIVVALLSLALGLAGTGMATAWFLVGYLVTTKSCPHVYSFNGQGFRLDADPLAGAFLPGGERSDWDRLEHLQAVDGQYRLRIVDELKENNHIDDLSLWVVDHPRGTTVLPTVKGELLSLDDAAPPIRALDGQGHDVLAVVRSADDVAFAGHSADFADSLRTDPRERLRLTFKRPRAAGHAVLWLRAHNAPFAEDSYVRYMALMGPGSEMLLRLSQHSFSYPYRQRIGDEIRRLGLPLWIRTGEGGGPAIEIGPVSPAVQRDFAVPVELPRAAEKTPQAEDAEKITLTLEMTPLFWEIDQVQLASASPAASPLRLRAQSAHTKSGRDVLAVVSSADAQRVSLSTGDYIEAVFAAPPVSPSSERTVVLDIRGYYETRFIGVGWLNPLVYLADRLGFFSLPRYALRRAHFQQGTRR